MNISYCYIQHLRQKQKFKRKGNQIRALMNFMGQKWELLTCRSQIFLTLKLPTYLNYYIYQSETIPRRSMYPIRPQFKPCLVGSSASFSFQKENLLSVLPTSLPGQTSNPNQYVGDDAGDASTLDSTLSKYTKCTFDSQESISDDYEEEYFGLVTPQKSQRKQLKKEMKKQKIKRKQFEKIILNVQNLQNTLSLSSAPADQRSPFAQSQSEKKNLENSFDANFNGHKIQKLTQQILANPIPKKKVHTENGSAPSKNNLPFLSLLQLAEVKILLNKSEDLKREQKLLVEQTRIIQQNGLQQFTIQSQSKKEYFIDDLKQELASKPSRKSIRKVPESKLGFIQNMIDHSEKYQLAIQNAKPQDHQIQKVNLARKPSDNGKKTLLIDLDDTLIFTSNPVSGSELKEDELKIAQNDGMFRKLNLRPFAREFLQRMSQHYQIIIFTAATKCYAEQIRSILDPTGTIISHLLDRQFCFNPNTSQTQKNKLPYIKDLRKLNRDLSQTVLLDNSIYCFWYQISNGIPIMSYNKENDQDKELLKVEKYLIDLVREDDVRIKNQKYFRLDQYEQHVDARTLVEELYMQAAADQ